MFLRHNTVLVIIDVQGKLARIMQNSEHLFQQLGILIDGARILEIPIIWMEQLPHKLGETVDEVKSHLQGIAPLSKDVFSCCGEPSFNSKLESLKPSNILPKSITLSGFPVRQHSSNKANNCRKMIMLFTADWH